MNDSTLESLSFEDSYSRLEEIIAALEENSLSLEESVALYEEGKALAEHCDRKLDKAQLRVTRILDEAEKKVSGISAG